MAGSPQFVQGVREAASALGMDPTDLATIISYETAGTFDPAKKGPTTQWGQHKGLIQFGEPQARTHGVDWNNAEASQLGADGAIVRYFRSSGWKPGMGMLDAYSIVNAGGPGLYNRSDANNGGAPGTVADKVRTQMGGHRKNAIRLLGGSGQPPQATVSTQGAAPMMQQEEQQPRGLLEGFGVQRRDETAGGETAQPFYQRDSFKDTAALLAQGFGRMGIMGMEEIADDIAKQRTENKAKNKTVEFLRKSGRDDLADAVANNVLGARDAASAMFAKPKTTAKEQQIQRLMSTGVPENIAIGIADGRLVVSRDPVTGEATIVDKAQLMPPEASPTAPVEVSPQEAETAGTFEGKNVKGALGAMGFAANILNTVVDVLGGEQPADKISDASTALQGLAVTTELGLAAQFPGRPSNLTRERIAELTIRPGELTLGKGKALNKAQDMVETIEGSLSKANAVLEGRSSPADVSAAKQSIALLTPLLADYTSLVTALQPTTPAAIGGAALRPEVVDRLGAYK